MNKAQWIAKKNLLCSLIKKISDHYGGDDLEWLKEYAREVITINTDNLDVPIAACYDLIDHMKWWPKSTSAISSKLGK